MILVSNDFFKHIPIEYKNKIIEKIQYFETNLLDVASIIRDIPSGFWIRRINNTNIFKFRLNNKDRILFTFVKNRTRYIDDNNRNINILLLEYCKHDDQIRKGKNIDLNYYKKNNNEFDIYKDNYCDDKEMDTIEKDNYYEKKYLDLNGIEGFLVEDEYIPILLNENNEDYLYYLSSEQYKCIDMFNEAIMLTGSAGSGKTTVAVHKLFWCSKNSLKVAYFTYTKLLKDNVSDVFNKFKKNREQQVDFFSLNDYYSTVLNIDGSKIVTFSNFKKWFHTNSYKYNLLKNLDVLDIWIEIKGILKGYVGLEAKEIYSKNINKYKVLSLNEYKSLPKGYSIFENDIREQIHKLCCSYQQWLTTNGYFDENDLAIKVLENVFNNKIEPYDFIIIDEVQDLSEIQLYMLSKLVENSINIMFCGDFNQLINPNFFKFERIKNIYYAENTQLKEINLSKNYRNCSEIIKFLNIISTYRRKYIGTNKYDNIQQEVRKGGTVNILKRDEELLKKMITNIKHKHYSAIIVSNIDDKNKLISIDKNIAARVFTINEIKGLEYKNIYCYNIISSNDKYWNDIYEGKGKRNSKYRYFFNMLYVSVSRAKDNIYLYEENTNNKMLKKLTSEINVIRKYDEEKLNLTQKSTAQDWLKESEKLRKMDNLDKAQQAKEMAKESEEILKEDKLTDEVAKLIDKGHRYFHKKQYGKSIRIFKKVISIDKENAEAYHYLANSLVYRYGANNEAYENYDKSIKLNPNRYFVYIDKAAVLIKECKFKESIKLLETAIFIEPNIANAYLMISRDYYFLKKYKEADEYLKEALKYDLYVCNKHSLCWTKVEKGIEENKEIDKLQGYLRELEEMLRINNGDDDGEYQIVVDKIFKLLEQEEDPWFLNESINQRVMLLKMYGRVEAIVKIEGYKMAELARIKKFKELLNKKSIPENKDIQKIFIKIEEENKSYVYSNINRIEEQYSNKSDTELFLEYIQYYIRYTTILTMTMRLIASNKQIKEKLYKLDTDKFIDCYIKNVNEDTENKFKNYLSNF